MSLYVANILVTGLGLYFCIGFAVALFLVLFRIGHIDPAAKTMSAGVRALVFWGCLVLWPLMLSKIITQQHPPVQ